MTGRADRRASKAHGLGATGPGVAVCDVLSVGVVHGRRVWFGEQGGRRDRRRLYYLR